MMNKIRDPKSVLRSGTKFSGWSRRKECEDRSFYLLPKKGRWLSGLRIAVAALGLSVSCSISTLFIRAEQDAVRFYGTLVEAAPTVSSESGQTLQTRVLSTYGSLPLSFEVNQGQTDTRVRFLSHGQGHTLFLTPTEAVLALNPASESRGLESQTRGPRHILRMQLLSANPEPQMVGREELPGKVNYFIGNDPKKWRTHVPTYAKVQYQNVYAGIDLIYYGNQGQLEYDFVVAPGVDPEVITLAFTGMDHIEVDHEGNLILHISDRDVRLHRPSIYQDINGARQAVSGGYTLLGAETLDPGFRAEKVGFQVGPHDATRPLIIDPVLSYSTYLGGSGRDESYGIAVDASGNAYIVGLTDSSDFPKTNPLQPGLPSFLGAFVSKLNPQGSALIYSTYLGGSYFEEGLGIAVDAKGNAYVTGFTNSSDFPMVNPAQPTFGGAGDSFIVKLNPTGSALIYSTYLGGSGIDETYGIAVDADGNVYVTGETDSANFPAVNPVQKAFGGGPFDAFVTKLNPTGSAFVYSTYLGGRGIDEGFSIAADAKGNAYVAGYTLSIDFPITNALQKAPGGSGDAFVTKLNPAGSALYSTYLGGSGYEGSFGVAVDASGNVYLTGGTSSNDFPVANPVQKTLAGSTDAFVVKLNPTGSSLVYSTYLGGSAGDFGFAIALDASGNAYVTGTTNSGDFPTAGSLQKTFGGGFKDAFVTKLASTGSQLVYSTYLGGNGSEGLFGKVIVVDTSGSTYVTGSTDSTNFPVMNSLQQTFSGVNDAFIVKIPEPTPR